MTLNIILLIFNTLIILKTILKLGILGSLKYRMDTVFEVKCFGILELIVFLNLFFNIPILLYILLIIEIACFITFIYNAIYHVYINSSFISNIFYVFELLIEGFILY